jgi:hypothetical protein
MSHSDTPLSDLISDHIRTGTEQSFARFVEAFRSSIVGVVALGIPDGAVGTFVSTAEQPVKIGSTKHGGPVRTLAFADPPAFARKFGRRFNAEISGEAVLATVLLNPESEGILVNSAKEEVSLIIHRKAIQSLLGSSSGTELPSTRPWWKFW